MNDGKLIALISSLAKKNAEDGKGRFDELLYGEKFLKSSDPIRVEGLDWYAFDGKAWKWAPRTDFRGRALATCPKRYRKARNSNALLDYVEHARSSKRGELIGFYKFEKEEDGGSSILLNTSGGVVRVWSGGEISLLKHDAAYMFTEVTAAGYSETASCPIFQEVLEGSLPDKEDRELLQLFAGNILWPSSEFECALISYGKEGTGKSKIAEAISGTLKLPGAEGHLVTSLSMHAICDSKSYSLPNLRHAALNLGTEVDTVDLDESTNFKQLVSGETIEARRIYGEPEGMKTSCKLWFLANTLPRFKSGTGAELRRLRFLKFDVSPAKPDTQLPGKLAAERDGIFRWMVEGLALLQRDKAIPMGARKSRSIIEKFDVSNDPVGFFVKNYCVLERGKTMRKADLSDAFGKMMEDHGLNPNAANIFFRDLYHRFAPDVRAKRARQSASGTDINYVDGITLMEGTDLAT